jgi:hypothetical protein
LKIKGATLWPSYEICRAFEETNMNTDETLGKLTSEIINIQKEYLKICIKITEYEIEKIALERQLNWSNQGYGRFLFVTNELTKLELMKSKTEAWINLIVGKTFGYLHEFKIAKKHLKKGREVSFGRGDVVIGGRNAKVVQAKSTIQTTRGQVNSMIGKAANQLSGETGESPQGNERGVISMEILNSNNPWPFSSPIIRSFSSKNNYITTACEQIKTALNSYTFKTTGLNNDAKKWLTDIQNENLVKHPLDTHKNTSERYIPETYATSFFNVTRIRTRLLIVNSITVKIIHQPNIRLSDGTIHKMVFIATWKDNDLNVKYLRER